MCSGKEIGTCVLWDFRSMRRNPRVLLGYALGFCLCFFLTQRIIELSSRFHTDIQMLEPFIWCFADTDSILFASLALLLPLSQIPQLNVPTYYLVFRRGRANWICGQIATTVLISFSYALLLLVSSVLLTAGNSFWANHWSDTATVVRFAPEQFEVALTVIRKTVKLTVPYDCAGIIFFLLMQYVLFLTLLNLAVSLRFGKRAGMTAVIAVSFGAYLLTPDQWMNWLHIPPQLEYMANTLAAWVSPLSHASYSMHSFGYGGFPSVLQSHAVFGCLNLGLLLLSYGTAKNMEFSFSGGFYE